MRPALLCAALTLAPLGIARPTYAADPPKTTDALTYTTPQDKHYLRASLELTALLAAGAVQYATEQGNSTDWDLNYDWPSFRKKLSGEAVRFDTNRFDTNMITHPAAGALYYLAARGNRLSVLESFLFTAATSSLWEYVGEFREKASINDLIVTPVAGMVFGETFAQLGILLERSRRTPVTQALAWFLAPSKAIHDTIDGAIPVRSQEDDDFGLTRDEAHRFELSAGASATQQAHGPLWGDARFELHTHVLNVPHTDDPVRSEHVLTDANLTALDLETSIGRIGLTDFQLYATIAPLLWYTQSLEGERGALRGQRLVLGATVGFDYGVHRYDRTDSTEMDQISGVHAFGLAVEHDVFAPPVHVRTTLALRPGFAAVHSAGFDTYARRGGALDAIPSVTRDESYYFATSATVAPSVELSAGPFSIGALARFDAYFSVEGLDRYQEQIKGELALHDRRTLGRAWLGYAPASWLALKVGADARARDGEVGPASARARENALWTSVGAVF